MGNYWSNGDEITAEKLNGTVPCGAIFPFAGSSAPTDYLICDGSAISRTTYSNLYAVIGTTYGTGDGSTTFNLPDLRSRVPVGKSTETEFDTLGKTGGEKTHQLTVTEMPAHTHTTGSTLIGGSGQGAGFYTGSGQTSNITGSTGGNGAHNNLQPYITLNYIIKAY